MSSTKSNKRLSADEIDIGRLYGELIDHRKLILSITAISVFISILYCLFATPIYQADALIQVEQKQGNTILESLSQALPDAQPQSAPEISLLQSRMVLGKTVDDLKLQTIVTNNYFPIVGKGWARLFGDNPGNIYVENMVIPEKKLNENNKAIVTVINDSEYTVSIDDSTYHGKVGVQIKEPNISLLINKIDAQPGESFKIKYKTRLEAINDLANSFHVEDQGKDTGMLALTLIGDDSSLISVILNKISENYLEQNVSRQAAQDARSLEFLNERLPKVRDDLDRAEDKLNSYRKQKDSVDLSLEAKATLDQLVNVDNQINELTFREAEISQLFTKDHPTYKALIEKKNTLSKERGLLNNRISAMPATQQEVLRLSRDVESGRTVYMMLLNRQQELEISKSSAIGNVRIVDESVTEPEPVKPKKAMVIILGVLLGGLISVGVVLLRVSFRRGIESPEQLEEVGISVYSSIPLSEWLESNKKTKHGDSRNLLAIDNPADLAIEAIRGLRTSLHFAMLEAKNNILMISGASPNAGKTFVSSNLAVIEAQTGKSVLFIDADMRKGYSHKLFGINIGNDNVGLSELLSSNYDFEKAINKIAEMKIDFISRGQVPHNPAEMLTSMKFDNLLRWAASNYDLVIVDTPPVLAVTDAEIIGRYVGTTLLVARYETNTVKEMEVSIKRFERSGINVKGCILNGVMKKSSSYYGYGYNHYGYTYNDDK